MGMSPRCGVSDCNRHAEWVGFCGMHAWRFKKYGDPLAGGPPRERQGICSVDDCDTKARSRGLCVKHLTRCVKHGDVHYNERPQYGTDQITYSGAHIRIRKLLGDAKKRLCVECSAQAHHWAYDHADPDEKSDVRTGLPYSTDPAHYRAMCMSCHTRFDKRRKSAQVIRAE